MISYLILHYNRPYLLEANIRLIREYAPQDTQIVVADDGSLPEVVKRIKTLPIDDIFVQKKNKNEWIAGTCSDTISKGRRFLKGDVTIFSEDDFFFCPDPVDDRGFQKWEIMPPIKYASRGASPFFAEAATLISKGSAKNVQMARDDFGWKAVPVTGKIATPNYKWKYIDHTKKTRFYFCNWPHMMLTKHYRSLKIRPEHSIWSLEGHFDKEAEAKFGNGNWAVVPERRRYIHVGMPFSKRLNSFANSARKRANVVKNLQSDWLNKVAVTDIEAFNKLLLRLWLSKKFYLDMDDIFGSDLRSAFFNAFKRVEGDIL